MGKARILLLFGVIFLLVGPFHRQSIAIGAGVALGTTSQIAHFLWKMSFIFPDSLPLRNEYRFFSRLSSMAAYHMLTQGFKKCDSLASWNEHRQELQAIPSFTDETDQTLAFLERRFLAKANGFYSMEVDWVCPSFGYSIQVHPESTNSYARDPASKASKTYLERVEMWKQLLPHPSYFPLILTRPFDISLYLPENIVDLSDYFSEDLQDWNVVWEELQRTLIDEDKIYIQRLKAEGIGGLRILPLDEGKLESQYRYLLNWISCFGLSANPVELDRFDFLERGEMRPEEIYRNNLKSRFLTASEKPALLAPSPSPNFLSLAASTPATHGPKSGHPPCQIPDSSGCFGIFPFSKIKFFEEKKVPHESAILVNGMVKALNGLLQTIESKKVFECPTRKRIAEHAFGKIKKNMDLVREDQPFYIVAGHMEQVQAHIISLLEIFSPFTWDDFSAIYPVCFSKIPKLLAERTFCTLHSCGMTSVAGILHAVSPEKVIYGENTYFECVHALEMKTDAVSFARATELDWKQADLLFVQFNPVLKRGEKQVEKYRIEDVSGMIRNALQQDKILTVALDCTLDFINSLRVSSLIEEFQIEIEKGRLNLICYRSGLKFDLFGMDNVAGAPFLMIHNGDPKWKALFTDPALQTDLLSLNWFCLAFQTSVSELEQYREQIFKNTKDLLARAPPRIFTNQTYRIVPVAEKVDPAFIDIKVSGPMHPLRASTLVAGCLYLESMEGGHPLFYRRSLGFYHPNFGIIFDREYTTIRLTLGLDPDQVELFANCFKWIDFLNSDDGSHRFVD